MIDNFYISRFQFIFVQVRLLNDRYAAAAAVSSFSVSAQLTSS